MIGEIPWENEACGRTPRGVRELKFEAKESAKIAKESHSAWGA